jgi:squalene-hopene/tetraprenyl-beta-curcumene cyclase
MPRSLPKARLSVALAALALLLALANVLATRAGSPPVRPAPKAANGSWNSKAAAAYLDQRAAYWQTWPLAARDHGTFCISCHTAAPYALARPALRGMLHETEPSEDERKLLENVTERVRFWNEVKPFYNDEKSGPHKTPEARGTEAILNALILARYDAASQSAASHGVASGGAPSGQPSSDTWLAFANMWALQLTSGDDAGSWDWLDFKNEPWEGPSSHYYGAALAALAVGTAPGNYGSAPEIQPSLKLLCAYLQRGLDTQTPVNQALVLWASSRLPELLTDAQKQSIAHELIAQQHEDGGWALATLVGPWKRKDSTPLEVKSDGYATGLVTLALEQSADGHGANANAELIANTNASIKRGLQWLAHNQDSATGYWRSYSLNKERDPSDRAWPFMNDAATAYAVLALTQNNSR